MKKIISYILLLMLILYPVSTLAKTSIKDSYEDKLIKYSNVKDDGKIHFYLFHSATCPHCKQERKFIKNTLKEKYKDTVVFYEYEVVKNDKYIDLYNKAMDVYNLSDAEKNHFPLTIIGEKYYLGFSDSVKSVLINSINSNINGMKETTKYDLPILGKVDAYNISVPLVGIILGLLDGFNPCALWILLFLINMMIGFKDRKKMLILGSAFLFTSGLVYFLSMLGISSILSLVKNVSLIQTLIGVFAIVAGIIQLRNWYKTRKDNGCHVVDDKKRKKIFSKMKTIMKENNFILAIIGIITLAASVNVVELACSIGFPGIYAQILAINNIHGLLRILYILLYCFFYMFDDFFIFLIALATFSVKGISNKYNKYVSIISGVIMLLMGILLILKPEWIMLNF